MRQFHSFDRPGSTRHVAKYAAVQPNAATAVLPIAPSSSCGSNPK